MSYRASSVPNDIEEELYFLEKSCNDVFEMAHKEINEQLSENHDPDPKLRELLQDVSGIKTDVLNLKQATLMTNKKLREGDINFSTITEEDIDEISATHLSKVTSNTVRASREQDIVADLERLIASRDQSDGANPESQDLFCLNESDVMVTENVESFIDPFSKLPITHPLKNRHCGHYFQKNYVLEYVSNQFRKCPYIGCNKYMSAKDLIEDHELRTKIARTQAK